MQRFCAIRFAPALTCVKAAKEAPWSSLSRKEVMDLRTHYLGLELRNPIVAAASPLSRERGNIPRLAEAGAAAIVFHSIFEEQLAPKARRASRDAIPFAVTPEDYLENIAVAKNAVAIPIIGSINVTAVGRWIEFAAKVEQAGADALELNIYDVCTDETRSGPEVEHGYISILRAAKEAVRIPVALKLGPYFSNFAKMAHRLDLAGADALVLFNRFFQPNIDPVDMMVRPEVRLSTPSDIRLPLRWISILHGKLRAQLAGTGGIYQAADVLRMLLAGADVVMLCSVLLRRGIDYLREIESELVRWMEHAGCTSIANFRGRFRHETPVGAGLFEREQYVRGLSGYTPQFLMEAASRGGQAG
jgi:dihydroorotate dehydrogenase (fumarate)